MNDFENYKSVKYCLYCMIGQFLTTGITLEEADKLNIKQGELFSYRDYVEVCYHDFTSEGLLLWNYLDFKEDYISHEEIWDKRLNLKYEKEDIKKDYHDMYLKMSILLADMVMKYYHYSITLNEARKMNIPFDEEDDELDGEISACFHIFESAGENAWEYFEIEEPIVGISVFEKKRNYYVEQLLEKKKVKKLK